jgi:hypothetical protein
MKRLGGAQTSFDPNTLAQDFGAFVRGKYIERLRERSNAVVIDPDIAGLFPNEGSVNDALRCSSRDRQARRQPPAAVVLSDYQLSEKRADRGAGNRTLLVSRSYLRTRW